MHYCINLCDIISNEEIYNTEFIDHLLVSVNNNLKGKLDTIYIGSYFCDNYFLKLNIESFMKIIMNKNISVTLVLPVFSQLNLECGKEKICNLINLFGNKILSVVVNDFGMLVYIKEKYPNISLIYGRLFYKIPRDLRIQNFSVFQDSILNIFPYEETTAYEIECDNVNIANLSNKCFIHYPYVYMTTSNICKFASIHKNIDRKFRSNDCCDMACMNSYEIYPNNDMTLYRLGKSILYKSNIMLTDNIFSSINIIYLPVNELLFLKQRR